MSSTTAGCPWYRACCYSWLDVHSTCNRDPTGYTALAGEAVTQNPDMRLVMNPVEASTENCGHRIQATPRGQNDTGEAHSRQSEAWHPDSAAHQEAGGNRIALMRTHEPAGWLGRGPDQSHTGGAQPPTRKHSRSHFVRASQRRPPPPKNPNVPSSGCAKEQNTSNTVARNLSAVPQVALVIPLA